jgi:CheY-like chemotaxis protein
MKRIGDLSVMLLEDEFLIALDAEDILDSLGVKDVQVVNTIAKATVMAQSANIDVAILDLNINGAMSFGVAEILLARRIPIVFASGYELRGRIDAEMEDTVVHLRKPYTGETLKAALEEALSKADAALEDEALAANQAAAAPQPSGPGEIATQL